MVKRLLKYGYIRNRNDDMSEYTIVGVPSVHEVIKELYPYLRLKRPHAELAFKIIENIPKRYTPEKLIAIGKLVDQYAELNYSKRRKNTSETIEKFFADKLATFPRND